MRRLSLLVCLIILLAAPAIGHAQDTGVSGRETTVSTGPEGTDPMLETADPSAVSTTSLPAAPPVPRTLRAYWHVFAAFAIAWGLLFGYAVVLGRRFGALEQQVKRLEGSGV